MKCMSIELKREFIERLREELPYAKVIVLNYEDVLVEIPPTKLRETVEIVQNRFKCLLRTCAASDEREVNKSFAMYYIFGNDSLGLNIIVKTMADSENPVLPSISDISFAADWCELEAYDLMGIRFSGRKLYRFILPPSWPEGLYPLRKDVKYPLRVKASVTGERIGLTREAEAQILVPLGPYHPALHEPEYFELLVEGERVVGLVYRGFHVHRGIEKIAEVKLTYDQIPFLAERICGICGFTHSTAYCQAVEKAAKIDTPERAQYIRSILLEIERIHSHLLWIGVVCHILGYDAGFMHLWRIRERVMVLAEKLTGSRKMYSINKIGGIRRDIDRDRVKEVQETLSKLKKEFMSIIDVITSVPEIVKRLKGTGILPRSEALKYAVVGPVARGSGLKRDVRKDYPYAAYREVSFDIPVYTEGDNLARFLVRVEEVKQSIAIIEQLLDKLPGGPICISRVSVPEGIIAVSATEAPRGENVHFIITGRGRPYRWRVRAPTYQNIPALNVMLKDTPLADAPITIASIDPCFSCTDRIIVVDVKTGRRRVLVSSVAGGVLSHG